MLDIPSRESLADLTRAVTRVVPSQALGFARAGDDGRVAVLCCEPHSLREYVVPEADLPDVLRLASTEPRQASAASIAAQATRAIEWHWQFIGVQRVLSLMVPGLAPPTRLWIGLPASDAPSAGRIDQLQTVAASAADGWRVPLAPAEESERWRRLELAAGLLPALGRVLDVRDVFDRLSAISRQALPHDMVSLGLYNDDLTEVTLHAQTGRADPPSVHKHPYPPWVTRAWTFDILDDRLALALERDRPPTRLGARSSVRFQLSVDDRIIGGIGFSTFEPTRYTTADLAVGRRLADFVTIALSHHRLAEKLAEQARRTEEVRARAAQGDLLDEALASVTAGGLLRDVFERLSSVTQRVIPHDALVLAARLPDGRHGKVYASASSGGPPFPDILDVPPPMLANPAWEFDVVDDLQSRAEQRHLWLAQQGYRGVLRLPIRLDDAFVGGVSFLSFTPRRYSVADVPAARRIVNRIALSFARERGATLLKQADEAAARASRLEARVRALTDELDVRTGYRRVVGESPEWQHVLTQAAQVAGTEATVLLLGESGTGKEVVARFLHRASARKDGPFVGLNCAALPEQLLEAELFGYERGAFTGATQSKPGQLEQAAGGTLFLDEVAEMSPSAQSKFLRVLQEREFQRLGGVRTLRADARVIAATNRDLPRAIAQGSFRDDLYYRLNVFAIHLPPLRERRKDIVPLSEAFLAEIGRGLGRPAAGISRDARTRLLEYDWPGNVRELRNILERASILCEGGLITAEHVSLNVTSSVATPAVRSTTQIAAAAPVAAAGIARPTSAGDLQSMEREMIAAALQMARFNKSKASKALGLTRQQLYLRMRKYGLE